MPWICLSAEPDEEEQIRFLAGQVYGDTGASGGRPNPPVAQYGLNRTIAWAVGIDYNETAFSPNGRPFTIGATSKMHL